MAKDGYQGYFDLNRYRERGGSRLKETLSQIRELPPNRKELLFEGLGQVAAYLERFNQLPEAEMAEMLRLFAKGAASILEAYQAVHPPQDSCRAANMTEPCDSRGKWELARGRLPNILKIIRRAAKS